MMDMFIKSIQLDESNRIVVTIQDHFAEYLSKEESKKMLKDMALKVLEADFVKLEVAKSSFRITVIEGAEAAAKEKVEQEIVKGIEMAMSFMSQMNKQE
ncbi:hypothetical protein QE109_11585 [Fusibacter bizertensis]|uniref:Uncharacterized protein n=1 Tax=Fusibacter bizertensis TaxID=1488331 RepID=A0ABT6NED9_9FIRM|nr:hypothetical protein [Fusibacter bizertensis]MDH8678795.1 hypothetical protein [Fusibacter bizertensis]